MVKDVDKLATGRWEGESLQPGELSSDRQYFHWEFIYFTSNSSIVSCSGGTVVGRHPFPLTSTGPLYDVLEFVSFQTFFQRGYRRIMRSVHVLPTNICQTAPLGELVFHHSPIPGSDGQRWSFSAHARQTLLIVKGLLSPSAVPGERQSTLVTNQQYSDTPCRNRQPWISFWSISSLFVAVSVQIGRLFRVSVAVIFIRASIPFGRYFAFGICSGYPLWSNIRQPLLPPKSIWVEYSSFGIDAYV